MGNVARLLLLGIGQVAVVAGAVMAGQFAAWDALGADSGPSALIALVLAFVIPAWVLAPVAGRVAALGSRQILMRWASMFLAVVGVPFLFVQGAWLVWWFLVSVGLAFVLPLRASFLGVAARAVHASFPRLITVGIFYTFAASFLGWILGLLLWRLEGPGLPLSVGYAVGLFALGLATTLVSPFPGDGAADAPRTQSLPSLFRQLSQAPTFRWGLPTGALIRGGVLALAAWLLFGPAGSTSSATPLHMITLFLYGAGAATLLTSILYHPRRLLGVLPFALTAAAIVLFLQAASEDPLGYLPALGWITGFLLPPLQNALFMELEDHEHLPAEFLRRACDFAAAGFWGLAFYILNVGAGLSVSWILLLVALATLTAAIASWYFRKRDAFELLMELPVMLMYRFRSTGPGLAAFPRRGPAVVIANHACWLDPIFLGKALPRKIIPMMTSLFYDLPGMRWFFEHFIEAIRVESNTYRRDVPELLEAVAALDRGEILVIFPEGSMRRRQEQWLKQFGQGVVHILRERPDTPVFTVWIEGNFGSFFSYFNGPPTKNKKKDFRYNIEVAVAAPQKIDPALLEDLREARTYLMQAVIDTRGLLGLEVPPLQRDIGTKEEKEGAL